MRSERIVGLTILLVVLSIGAAIANPPQNMNVQGRLTNAAGNPVPTGLKNFTFKIFDMQAGGTEIWPAGLGETQGLVTDANGLWTARVGALIPLTDGVFTDSSRWLEVTVDDGVNPIETLPRIKLNKTPYTSDQYVNTSGDLMTGQLRNYWTQEDSGTNVDIENNNDGYGSYWNNGPVGTWGLQVEAQSNDNAWNIGVASAAIGDNNYAFGNVGVYGEAIGSGTSNIGVYGETFMNGTSNYSGFFTGGDFVVQIPSTPGTAGVALPNNAISDEEIFDEPGMTSSSSDAGSINTTQTLKQSVTINCPDTGYVIVISQATFNAQTANVWVNAVLLDNGGFASGWYWDPGDVDTWYDQAQSNIYTAPVSAGPHTYELYLDQQLAGTAFYAYCKVTALYVPTTYGSVAAPVAAQRDVRALPASSQPIPEQTETVNRDAERAASIAANQARIDNEMAAMRTRIEQLEAQLHKGGVSPIISTNREK